MSYKKPTPIAKLVKNILQTTPYQTQYITGKIMIACEKVCPFLQGTIDKLYMKNNILHLKLNSCILAHEIRLNKEEIIRKLQKELAAQPISIQNMIIKC